MYVYLPHSAWCLQTLGKGIGYLELELHILVNFHIGDRIEPNPVESS